MTDLLPDVTLLALAVAAGAVSVPSGRILAFPARGLGSFSNLPDARPRLR